MKKHRLLSLLLALCLVLSMPPVTAMPVSAAENVTLTIWTDGYSLDWIQQRLAAFDAEYPQWNVTASIEYVHPGDAGNYVTADPQGAADVYNFANDQLGSLVECGGLAPITGTARTQVLNDNADSMVDSVTYLDGKIYGIPYTSNTWFMYYDKSVFTEEDVKSLETMLTKGKVAFPITNGWYLSAFYFANGCTMFGENGLDAAAGIDFATSKGVAVTEYLSQLCLNENFVNQGYMTAPEALNGTADAVFSGTWDADGVESVLGSNYGAVQLPTVKINGQTRQLKAFAGSKAYGVNPHTDHPEAAMALAAFLANEESQLERYTLFSDVPGCVSLAQDVNIAANPAAKAQIATIANTSVIQPWIPEMAYYWPPAQELGDNLYMGNITAENAASILAEYVAEMNNGISITSHPSNQSKASGSKATFSVGASGTGLSYQWQYKMPSGKSWFNATATGNKTAKITVSATAAKNGYQYRCVITSVNGGRLITKPATLTVGNVISITTQPVGQKVKNGTTATFTVVASGSGLKYQWQYRTSANGNWINATAPGYNTATISVAATCTKSGYQYRCKITDGSGSVKYSNAVYLYVIGIKSQPVGQKVIAGNTAKFTVSATGHKKTFQWQYRTSASGTWKNATASGSTTATLSVPGTCARSGYQYRCKITDSAGNVVYSKAVYLYVLGIKTQPGDATASTGTTAKFTVNATGHQKTFQWQYSTDGGVTWKNTTAIGAKTATLSVAVTAAKNGYHYRCKITDSVGNVIFTNPAVLIVQ